MIKIVLMMGLLLLGLNADDNLIKRGEKIYNQRCNGVEFRDIIKDNFVCGKLNNKNIKALLSYVSKDEKDIYNIEVTKEEKCPVCGMFVYKYPRWVAQIFINKTHFSFDGVKDMMKFYLEPKRWAKNIDISNISNIIVTDYYSQKQIEARSAFYVIGSDIYGPMGHELIPFQDIEEAKEFKLDHNAKKIIKFKDIKLESVYKLDE